jgi:very-short-patch-repair endonuclease
MTDAERLLWSRLKRRQIAGRKFRRQHIVGRYIADFACLDAKLIVELDGGQHISQAAYDAERTAWLEEQGFQVLRFWNDDVLKDPDAVCDVIWRKVVSHLEAEPPP